MTRVLAFLLSLLVFASEAFSQTPPAPTDLRVSPMGNTTRVGVVATWRGVSGGAQYRIYRSPNDSAHFAAIGTSAMTSYVDTTITPGTRFYYFVKAFIGTNESGRSNIASILIPIPPPLPIPANLTAVNAPMGYEPAVRLNWRGGRGPWMYRIFRSTNNTNNFRSFSSSQDTTFLDRNVRGDSTYYYYVRSTYSLGDTAGTPRSNTASVLVVVPPRVRGTIAGTIIDDSTSAPIRNVLVTFFRVGHYPIGGSNSGSVSAGVRTDSLGRYTALLDTGRYILRANAEMCGPAPYPLPVGTVRYRSEYYNNCYEPACATIIVVAQNQTFTANMGLARLVPPSYNTISGVVRDTANHPLRNALVSIVRTMQEMNFLASLGFVPGIGDEAFDLEGVGHTRGVMWTGYTDSLGRYRARVLSNSRYVAMASKGGYLPEYWNNKPTAELADIIVLANRDTGGIDFSLAVRPIPNNSIAGLVRDSLGNRVPSRITLIPVFRNVSPYRYGHTDSLGAYRFTGIESGKYFVLASPFSGYGFAYYKAGAFGVNRIADADSVAITGDVTGINIGVRPIRSGGLTVVNGLVRSTTNASIGGVQVTAFDADGEVIGVGVSDRAGSYSIDAVTAGPVTVVADRGGYNNGETMVIVNENQFVLNNVNITLMPNGPTAVGRDGVVPEVFALHQNYPNPFNPSTTIRFEVPVASSVRMQIFNVIGQEVATIVNGDVAAGVQEVVWNGKDGAGRSLASGIYFYRVNARAVDGGREFSSMKKMLLLK